MNVLIASTPATGHLNPLLAVGHTLIAEGHEVVGLSGSAMRKRIEGIGASFRALPPEADRDLRDIRSLFPEIAAIPPGPRFSRFLFKLLFVDTLRAQHEGLRQVLQDFPADVIIADSLFLGTLPMLLGLRSVRPAIVFCGTTPLLWHRDDGAPGGAGLAPASNEAQREEYAGIFKEHESIFFEPVRRYLNDCLADMDIEPLSMNILDALVELPDAHLQLTTPSFEFPRQDLPDSVHFVGALPIIPNQAPLPPWTHELDDPRKVVLVTQGTFSNFDFGQLVIPTLIALANEPDLLVVVTAGGRRLEAIPGPIPSNARLASYLPFEWVLPKIDAFVTNGGYGSVNQALGFGVPIVSAGLSEVKADVSARVAWSGVGIDLKTDEPTPSVLREAIRAVLDKPNYRSRAASLAKEFASIDTRGEILRIIKQVSHVPTDQGAPVYAK
ncbi:MAG: nucleotide disphospho-sugar-binding domain-containing protein [Methylocella sp.]